MNEELVEVICSPAHMKAVANALGAAVKIYEEKFGEINPSVSLNIEGIRTQVQNMKFPVEST